MAADAIYPVQPYFVLNTTHYYKHRMADVCRIAHFYRYQPERAAQNTPVLPDGSADLIIHCDPNHPSGRLAGMVSERGLMQVEQGHPYFGVRFLPGCVPALDEVSASELVDGDVPLESVRGLSEVIERVAQEQDFSRQIDVFLRAFRTLERSSRQTRANPYLVPWMTDRIIATGGAVRIQALADEAGYSARYLNKAFHEQVGVAPKSFCRYMKFQRVIQTLNSSGPVNLAELSADTGYFDQSHLLRDFKTFTAVTPGQYLQTIQPESYHQRIIEA